MPDYAEMTSEELREPLLRAALPHVMFDGWTAAAMARGARDLGLSGERARIAFPQGPAEMVALHSRLADRDLTAALDALDPSSMKIREKVTWAVRRRLEMAQADQAAIERGLALLAHPRHSGLGRKLLWETADSIWRGIGDTSTDYNYYSKRTILAGVYMATLTTWLGDRSEDKAATWAFLDRRIAGVMRFEKTKARILKQTQKLPNPARILGRLRYGRAA